MPSLSVMRFQGGSQITGCIKLCEIMSLEPRNQTGDQLSVSSPQIFSLSFVVVAAAVVFLTKHFTLFQHQVFLGVQ